ncbi:hypothetical protein [Rathayibacter toxicus]|uniref:hypothetical protein n=1 Tax=Rathayibacter toxicus TaxID=145458 RepID=UPI000CE7CB4E|nr:hypothetical protein [Rathayibacter toxicus]PPI56826.1 hypothetical protein C5D35_00850 [Rathayibacter toxicus]QOD10407.1 hypothetical protein BSG36_11010 [Rathayibacter toxicus]QWL29077.1 hypothetical protein E2R33_11005 [Rathayibacter toxicus]
MMTIAASSRHDIWKFGSVQDITYITVTFPIRIDTVERLSTIEIIMAAWSLMRPEAKEIITAVKGFYRRKQEWITLEIVAPTELSNHFSDFITAFFDPVLCAELIEPARAVAARAIGLIENRNGLTADELAWNSVLAVTPASLRVPGDSDIERVSVAQISDALAEMTVAVKTVIVSGASSDFPLPNIGPFDCRSTEATQMVKKLSLLGARKEGGFFLTRKKTGSVSVRLILPFGEANDNSAFYCLLALCIPLGGTHHSLLARLLRDELGISYLPTASVEVISGELYIVAAWETSGNLVAYSLERSILMISTYFQNGVWRDQWQSAQAELLSIYEDSWSDSRGKGVFVASVTRALGSFPGYEAIINMVNSMNDRSLADIVSRVDLSQLSGAIVGDFEAENLHAIITMYGLQLLEARVD